MTNLKNILFFLLLILVLKIQGQQVLSSNFVQNPTFEEYYSCPIGYGEIDSCKYWWGFSSDYYNACTTTSFISVPSNGPGFQYAHTGNAYAGCAIYCMDIYGDDYRESIKTKLNDSLIVNKRYCTNFYVSIAEGSYSDNLTCTLLDSIGMLFTKYMVQDNVLPILNNGIKVQNSIKSIDTINWSKITNTFIAGNTAKYLTLGNFDTFIFWPPHSDAMMYVYMDDVSVCECSFKFNLGNDTTLCIGESLILSPNMPNATYTWQDGSTDSIYKVTQAGTYWVRAFFPDYNITTYDTINVAYIPYPVVNLGNSTILCQGQTLLLNATTNNATYLWQDGSTAPIYTAKQEGIYQVKVTDTTANCSTNATIILDCDEEPVIPNIFTPNNDGVNDYFFIKNIKDWNIDLQVFNRWGNEVYKAENYQNNWDGRCKGNPLADGTYFYIIRAKEKNSGIEKEYKGSLTILR